LRYADWTMTTAQWFTLHEHGGFPIECAALGACDLSVLHVGGEWQWLVRQAPGGPRRGRRCRARPGRRATASRSRRAPARLMTFLTRTDPTRNINRFYVVDVTPTLFGERGRRGSPGTVRRSSRRRRDEAQIAEQRTITRRLQHGYKFAKALT
jgi:predicted DNA-binding WGR domain protein